MIQLKKYTLLLIATLSIVAAITPSAKTMVHQPGTIFQYGPDGKITSVPNFSFNEENQEALNKIVKRSQKKPFLSQKNIIKAIGGILFTLWLIAEYEHIKQSMTNIKSFTDLFITNPGTILKHNATFFTTLIPWLKNNSYLNKLSNLLTTSTREIHKTILNILSNGEYNQLQKLADAVKICEEQDNAYSLYNLAHKYSAGIIGKSNLPECIQEAYKTYKIAREQAAATVPNNNWF